MVGAVCLKKHCIRSQLSFEEILLDETQVQGDIWVLKNALQKVGGVNYRLGAKKNYELLIRISKEYTILQLQEGTGEESRILENTDGRCWIHLEPEAELECEESDVEEQIKTDCYLISRYKTELFSIGCFDEAVYGVFLAGKEKAIQYLERMLLRGKDFYNIYDCTQPILIYRGSNVCYNVLDTFAQSLGQALEELGQCVEYFDMSVQGVDELAGYTKQRFKAVIGMQTYMFSVKWKEGYAESEFVHDNIEAPQYHFVFDHPILVRDHLIQIPHRLCVLTPDGNYAEFIKKYYGHPARFLPPAGIEICYENKDRDYEVVFLGSCGKNLLDELRAIRYTDRKRCYFLNRYILYMRREIEKTPEYAFQKVLEYYGISYTKKEFLEMFHKERWVIFYLADYYRNKIIDILLEAGIPLHVFGDSWKGSRVWGMPKLVWHEAAIGREALEVYARAKVSLNIMTWHKDGFTERIANAMLQKSVVVTDRTAYLEENFVNGKELLMFDLRHLKELPEQINGLLYDEKRRSEIAENGYKKALKQHTWDQRARKILEMIEEDKGKWK